MKRLNLKRALIAIGLLTTSVLANAQQCSIGFDNEFALTNVYGNARGTFAQHTGSSNGRREVCDPERHQACWTYRERCGSRGYVRVQESPIGRYGHFHLMFEDSRLTCFADNGDGLGSGYGRPGRGGACLPANWAREPRFAAGHTSSHFISIWMEDRINHRERPFDFRSIRIRGEVHAQLWIRKSNGYWVFWRDLPPGRWSFAGRAQGIMEIKIKAADGERSSVAFDDVVVRSY